MSETTSTKHSNDTIKAGDYVIIQRQSFKKLYRVKPLGTVSLGKDIVELDKIIGKKYYTTFRMVTKPKNKRVYSLEEADFTQSIQQNVNIDKSGVDNRDIIDDSSSQQLSYEEIHKLRDESLSSSDIVEKLASNSKTFSGKTEYSQEKYLKKKEKKYFEYIQIRKPTLRLVSEIYYRLDPAKVQGIRIDDLSQILSYANIEPDSNTILYDSGTSGLLTAAVMNTIGRNTTGTLIHMHPGNVCQREAFLAIKIPQEQRERCINVCLYSILRCYYQEFKKDAPSSIEATVSSTGNSDVKMDVSDDLGCSNEQVSNRNEDTNKNEDTTNQSQDTTNHNNDNNEANHEKATPIKTDTATPIKPDKSNNEKATPIKPDTSNNEKATPIKPETANQNEELSDVTNKTSNKRKLNMDESEVTTAKRPCWQIDNEKASKILDEKVDSLIIVAKEHLSNIVHELLKFLNYGRPFVVFNLLREPLQSLYVELKNKKSYVALNLSNNFLRYYQVLENRTHPDVNMTSGGYILTGFKIDMRRSN